MTMGCISPLTCGNHICLLPIQPTTTKKRSYEWQKRRAPAIRFPFSHIDAATHSDRFQKEGYRDDVYRHSLFQLITTAI